MSLLPPFPAGNVCPHKHRARIPRIASAIAQRLSGSFDPQQLNKSGFELCALSADNWICYESAQNAAAKSCEYLSLSPCFIRLKTSKAVSLSRPWSVSNPPLSTCPSALAPQHLGNAWQCSQFSWVSGHHNPSARHSSLCGRLGQLNERFKAKSYPGFVQN